MHAVHCECTIPSWIQLWTLVHAIAPPIPPSLLSSTNSRLHLMMTTILSNLNHNHKLSSSVVYLFPTKWGTRWVKRSYVHFWHALRKKKPVLLFRYEGLLRTWTLDSHKCISGVLWDWLVVTSTERILCKKYCHTGRDRCSFDKSYRLELRSDFIKGHFELESISGLKNFPRRTNSDQLSPIVSSK